MADMTCIERQALERQLENEVDMFGPLDLAAVRRVNAFFRKIDDSALWPIRDRFNATERAIRRLCKARETGCGPDCPYSYKAALESEIAAIVNDSRNW